MPRSNRPRRNGPSRFDGDGDDERDLSRVLFGGQHAEVRHGREFTVQSISGASSSKSYTCPGCSLIIEPGTPHIVAWRADGLFGEDHDLKGRRHWHNHCWRIS